MKANERARRYRARKRGEAVELVKPGPKPGFTQSKEHVSKRVRCGPEHHAWKGDDATVKGGRSRAKRKFKTLGACQKCGDTASDRHHADGNPRNNADSNVAILCEPCHIRAHGKVPRK